MRTSLSVLLVPLLLLSLPAVPVAAQDEEAKAAWAEFMSSIDWVRGPGEGRMGELATIELFEGYVFTGLEGTKQLMEAMGNLITDQEQGFVAPASLLDPESERSWFIVFEFDDIGYVERADEEDLDRQAILDSLKKGNQAANREKRKMGLPELTIMGWAKPPYYDPQTKNLEWATRARGDEGYLINHNIRLLGRRGVMSATLVVDPPQFKSSLVEAKSLLSGFSFRSGHTYGEYREGDKIWKYGLTGLIVGGGVAVAAKVGLLAKIWKVLWKVLIFVGVAGAALFRKLTGGGKNPYGYRRGGGPSAPSPPEA